MNMKKFLAGAFAGALALSLSVPAFASAMTNPTETLFSGAAAPLTVSVSVKKVAAPKLYVNPYGMSYSPADSQVLASASLAAGDMVIEEAPTSAGFYSDTAVLENNSTAALGVKVTLKSESPSPAGGTASTAVVVATEPAANAAPAVNTLFGHFEIADATAVTGSVNNVTGVITVTPDWTSAKQVVIPACSAGGAGTATTNDTTYTLAAATESTDMSGNTTTTPGYAAFRLTGNAYVGTAGNSWAATDLINVTVAFTFTPAAASSNP